MKKCIIFLLVASNYLFAEISPSTKPAPPSHDKDAKDKAHEAASFDMHQKAAAALKGGTSDVIIVDPKVVAKDWVDAFHMLQQKRIPHLKFVLKDGAMIENVSEVESLPGGYLLLFTIRTVQGVRFHIIKTSEIVSLMA